MIKNPFDGLDEAAVLSNGLLSGLFSQLLSRQNTYAKIDRYINGDHDLQFATSKFSNTFGDLFREFAENLMPRVVGSLSDYVQLDKLVGPNEEAQTALDEWTDENLLKLRSGQVTQDTYTYGDGYVILAPDTDNELRLYRQDSRSIEVLYDVERPDYVIVAIKVWQELDGYWRLNVYTPTSIYRYRTKLQSKRSTPKLTGFVPYSDDGSPSTVELPLQGAVPVFHFANEPDAKGQGKSELKDLFPLQDALNKDVCDRLVAQEFQAFRQRWATGIEVSVDPASGKAIPPAVPGIDRLWFSGNPDAKFGDFDPIDITQYLKVAADDRQAIARLARIPLHTLELQNGDFPSGEAQKTAEGPILTKTWDRQLAWGVVWSQIGAYVLAFLTNSQKLVKGVTTTWIDVTPRSDVEEGQANQFNANAASVWNELGVPKRQLLIEKGYTDQQIDEFEKQKQQEDEQSQQTAQNAIAKALNDNQEPVQP